MTVYLDCNATTPIEPEVLKLVHHIMAEEVGNAGSRTHEFGQRAKKRVQKAREQVASVVKAQPDEVIFTSGATEGNNIAILGLAHHGEQFGKKHLITTTIEHKAVLEPFEALESRGFEVTYLKPNRGGVICPESVQKALRQDTLLISVMHVNNETGVEQPITEIAEVLKSHETYFHTDAAQGFGKSLPPLQDQRIDLISTSSHKIYGPIGVGALIIRKRDFKRPPLKPLMYGGGQERGLRPGTLPVALIAGFGLAAELAQKNHKTRQTACTATKNEALSALKPLKVIIHGEQGRVLPHVLSLSTEGVDSEAVMVALKGVAAISNGSACTSSDYKPSHVLQSMGLSNTEIQGALRLSWSHLSSKVPWQEIRIALEKLL